MNMKIHTVLYLPFFLYTVCTVCVTMSGCRSSHILFDKAKISMRISSFLNLTLVLIYIFRIFEKCLDWNTENSRPARQQLSHPSSYLAIHLPTKLPISLLSHSSFYLAIHLPTQPTIFLLFHPSPYLATHFLTQPFILFLSYPSPYSTQPPISLYLAIHLHTQPPMSILSHPYSCLCQPSPYLHLHTQPSIFLYILCVSFFGGFFRNFKRLSHQITQNDLKVISYKSYDIFYRIILHLSIGLRMDHSHNINLFCFGSAIKRSRPLQ